MVGPLIGTGVVGIGVTSVSALVPLFPHPDVELTVIVLFVFVKNAWSKRTSILVESLLAFTIVAFGGKVHLYEIASGTALME